MAGDPGKRAATGDQLRFTAALYNKLLQIAAWFDSQRQSTGGTGVDLGSHEGLVYVKNTSGVDVPRFGVMTLGPPAVLPADSLSEFQNRPVLTGVTPTTTNPAEFCIASEPHANGEIKKCWVFGTCPVQINIIATTDQFADTTDGDNTQLTSGSSGGARILWSPATTGTQWALVRLGNGPAIEIFHGSVVTAWDGTSPTISVAPSTGGSNIDVNIEMGGSTPQYCGCVVDEAVAYFSLAGTMTLLRNRLPTLTAQYQGWYRNAEGVIVADWLRASDTGTGGSGGSGGGSGEGTTFVYVTGT